jgi:hypothetical protein
MIYIYILPCFFGLNNTGRTSHFTSYLLYDLLPSNSRVVFFYRLYADFNNLRVLTYTHVVVCEVVTQLIECEREDRRRRLMVIYNMSVFLCSHIYFVYMCSQNSLILSMYYIYLGYI